MSSDWTSGMPAFNSVASSWLNTRNSWRLILRLSPPKLMPPKPSRGLSARNVQTLFLELTPEGGFALGDVNALDDLTRRSAEAAAVLHP
jgi:hypothetical protein